MTTADLEQRFQELENRIAELERRNVFSRYGLFHAPAGVLVIVLSFTPIYDSILSEEYGLRTFPPLWGMVFSSFAPPAVLAALLVVALVALLFIAAVFPLDFRWPLGIAACAFMLLVMLIVKPGTGFPTPELSVMGEIGVAVLIGCIGLGVGHAFHAYPPER